MTTPTLLPFGDSSVATVHPSGVIDIRVVDDREHQTLTSRMTIGEFARIAKIVFMNVRNDTSNDDKARDRAANTGADITDFMQEWG